MDKVDETQWHHCLADVETVPVIGKFTHQWENEKLIIIGTSLRKIRCRRKVPGKLLGFIPWNTWEYDVLDEILHPRYLSLKVSGTMKVQTTTLRNEQRKNMTGCLIFSYDH